MKITEDSGKNRLHLCEICGHRFKLKCDFSRHRSNICKTSQQKITTSESFPTNVQKDTQLPVLTSVYKVLPDLAQLPVLTPMNSEPPIPIPLDKTLPVLTSVSTKLPELTMIKQHLPDIPTKTKINSEPMEFPPVATNIPVLAINKNIPVLALISEVLENFNTSENLAALKYP